MIGLIIGSIIGAVVTLFVAEVYFRRSSGDLIHSDISNAA